MTLNLNQTLSWTRALGVRSAETDAELAMLHDLQANILKGHGRHYTVHLVLAFDPQQILEARHFLCELGCETTSALTQLNGAELYKATGVSMTAYVGVLLSAAGYDALNLNDYMPENAAFRAGMQKRALSDPPPHTWDRHLARDVHGLIIVGVDTPEEQAAWLQAYQSRIAATGGAVRLLGHELGQALFNEDGNGIEHFGYVDGRSQPLALQEDIERERAQGGTSQFDPAIPLSQLLVRCPGGTRDASHGSYFVFRKLEQNVRGFKRREEHLAELMDNAGERAGASVVGRFENGTPVTLHDDAVPAAQEG
ncbi:MAG: peroxidase, partial [Gammaproteobacteria bacterium]